jgi:hypothetical protein
MRTNPKAQAGQGIKRPKKIKKLKPGGIRFERGLPPGEKPVRIGGATRGAAATTKPSGTNKGPSAQAYARANSNASFKRPVDGTRGSRPAAAGGLAPGRKLPAPTTAKNGTTSRLGKPSSIQVPPPVNRAGSGAGATIGSLKAATTRPVSTGSASAPVGGGVKPRPNSGTSASIGSLKKRPIKRG